MMMVGMLTATYGALTAYCTLKPACDSLIQSPLPPPPPRAAHTHTPRHPPPPPPQMIKLDELREVSPSRHQRKITAAGTTARTAECLLRIKHRSKIFILYLLVNAEDFLGN